MPYTVRIYSEPDLSAWDDHAFETMEEAYALLWSSGNPLPEETEPTRTEFPCPYGYSIAQDGFVIHSFYAELAQNPL